MTVEQVNEGIQLVLAKLPNTEQEECLKCFIAGKDVIDLLPTGSFTAYTILGSLNSTGALPSKTLVSI